MKQKHTPHAAAAPEGSDAPSLAPSLPEAAEVLVDVEGVMVTRQDAIGIDRAALTRDDLPPDDIKVVREYLARLRAAAREENHTAVLAIRLELDMLGLYREGGRAGGRGTLPALVSGRKAIAFRRVVGGAALPQVKP